MEREVIELLEAAKRAARVAKVNGIVFSSPEVSRCVEALNKLKVSMNLDLILSTDIPRGIYSLTNHQNLKIKSMASCLLDVWRRLLYATSRDQKAKRTTTTRTPNVMGIRTARRDDDRRKSLDDEKKKSLLDPSREKVREMLVEGLSKVATDDQVGEKMINKQACEELATKIAISVESMMFAKLGQFHGSNNKKYRSILFNIRDQKNPDLRRKVLLGDIKAERLITMSGEELASNQMQFKLNQIKQRKLDREEASLMENADR